MISTDVFILRPVLAAVLSVVLVLLGGMAYTLLGVRETPDVQAPVVTVTTSWPGADPAIVESDVTEVLERQLNGIEGVQSISSTSQEQSSQITVEFDLERDLEAAANDVRSRVARARRELPDDAEEPVVEKADANSQPVMFLRLAAEGRSLLELTEIADTLVRERIENVPGVSGVDIFGAQKYAMRVELDAVGLAARGLTVQDVEAALRAGNVDLPAGRLEGESTELTLHVAGGLATREDFAALVVGGSGPSPVRLGDVARVRIGAENERTAARADGLPSISLALTPQAQANIIDISDEVQARLEGISRDLPAGVELVIAYDRSRAVRTSIEEVEETLLIAFGLVVLVIFAFLRDWRSTLIPALAIPVSLVGTFLFIWMAGFSINVFTLFGLVLAIGLVVDDAIVVLENIVRRIEGGEGVLEATLAGTRQIVFAVIATTISLVAVFLPVIFTGGATGRLFVEFGTTVAVSVAISAFVALTLTPMLCAQVLRPAAEGPRGGLFRWSEAAFDALNRGFAASLRAVARRRWPVLPVIALSVGGGWWGFTTLPTEFFPLEDRNVFMVRTLAPEGASFRWMDARMGELEPELMEAVPERIGMLSRVASGRGGVASPANSGMFIFPLVPAAERERSQQEIVASLRPILGGVTAFMAIPIQFPTVSRGFGSPLQFVLLNPDYDALVAELPRFVQAMREVPGLTAVNEDLKLNRPALRVDVDRDRAAALGVPLRDVARTLQVMSSGLEVSTFKRGIRQYPVITSLPAAERMRPDDLAQVRVRSRDGGMVPLANLVRFREGAEAASRYHHDRAPSATIGANLDGITLGQAIERVRRLADETLPPGFRTALAGESREFEESSSSLATIFLLALALVYLTLAAQFDSFVAPISILLAVPLALAGAFLSLAAAGMTLSFFSQVGLILLVGLVTKNGILIVEYARQLQEDGGMPVDEAAVEATRLRFRPILMTSVATIGGALPIALGFSGTGRAPLGVAVVGGMAISTVLTLYVTPVVYATLAGRVRRPRPTRAAAAAVALLAALLPWPARADGALDLGGALRAALEGNLALRGSALDVEGARAGREQTRAGLLPAVGGTVSGSYGSDPRSAVGAAGGAGYGSATVRADVPLLDLSAVADLRAAGADVRAAEAGFDVAAEEVLADVAARFVELQRARQAVGTLEAQISRSERLLRLAEDRLAVGAASRIEVTRARFQLRQDEVRRIAARTAEVSARLRLAEALGLPIDAELAVSPAAPLLDADGIPGEAELEGALARARSGHPEIEAGREGLAGAREDRRAGELGAAPTLSGFVQGGGTTAFDGEPPSPTTSAGLTLSVPLFSGLGRRAEIRGLRARERAAALDLEAAERAVEVDLRAALRGLRDAGVGLEVAGEAEALAAEELALAEDRYRAGAGGNVEVVEAQARLAEASQARVDAVASFNLAVVSLFRSQGRVRDLARGAPP